MKKRLMFLLLASPLIAKEAFTGFFIGAKAGGDLLTGKNKYQSANGDGKSTLRKIGGVAGLGAGYMYLNAKKMLMGGEVYYDIRTAKTTQTMATTIPEGKFNVAHKNSIGIAAFVGAAANPKLVAYAKFAYELNSFEIKLTNLPNGAADVKLNKRISGLLPGAGIMYKLSDSIIVGAEYSYAILTDLKTTAGTLNTTYSPAENRVSGSIRWIF